MADSFQRGHQPRSPSDVTELAGANLRRSVMLDYQWNTLRDQGYVLISGVGLDNAVSMARGLGMITMDRRSPELVRRISPQPIESAKPNTLSSRYGSGRFPFHTDAAHWEHPPDFVCLYCECPGSGGRPTELIDTHAWKIKPQLRLSLLSDIWKTGFRNPWLCTVGSVKNGDMRIRYDVGCMEPRGTSAARTQIEIERIICASTRIMVTWSPKSLLVINNSRMLHARGNSTRSDADRVLLRILVGGQQ
jgi:hypothetical protein